jgi:ribosomal protein S18 acetylase RimI-like enzyme/orotate phosphoribosyltransferase
VDALSGDPAPASADVVAIALESVRQPEVVRFIEALDAYHIALYPAESNHLLDLDALAGPDIRFFVARVAGQALGCGALRVVAPEYGEVKRMFVSPEARGRKLGRRLLEAIEERARREGLRYLRLETGVHQPEALALYRSAGFQERPPFGEYRPDPLSVFLEKRLAPVTDLDHAAQLDRLLRARPGHFRFESGHHGELWLELEALFLRPELVTPLAAALAARMARHRVEAVCGPLVEGAFVALTVAAALGVPFSYAEPSEDPAARGLFPVRYRLPGALRAEVKGKRVAVINDVINAGSAVRGALDDLAACGARPVALGTLLVLGDSAAQLAAQRGLALETLAARDSRLWTPEACPLCRDGVPLQA